MMSLRLFHPLETNRIPMKLDARIKIFISFLLFILILISSDIFQLIIILCFVFSLSFLTQGVKSTFGTLWYLKWYFLVFLGLFLLYSTDFESMTKTLLKLVGFIFSFVILSRTTNPDQLVDALIKLKLPPVLAWNIGVAIRQSIFLMDEISHILQIQRQRLNYNSKTKIGRFRYRIYEVYILLQSLISRSIVVSTDFTDALQARGYKKPKEDIITYTTSIKKLDLLFIFIYMLLPLTIILMLRHQFFNIE